MAAKWICGRAVQPVRVVHGDGQVLSRLPPVKVADILVNHPHHYICHMCPELPTNKSPMLPLDYDLEPGYLYFLLPLPKLFPTSSAGPPACCCRAFNQDTSIEEGHTTPCRESNDGKFGFPSPLRIKGGVQRIIDKIGSPARTAKKVSPELSRTPSSFAKDSLTPPLLSPTYGSSKSMKRSGGIGSFSSCRSSSKSPSRRSPNRASSPRSSRSPRAQMKGTMRESGGRCFIEDLCSMKWKPRLGCISETDALVTACEELRLCLDRRRLTFDSRLPRCSSPSRIGDPYRLSARERQPRTQKDDTGYFTKPSPKVMAEDGYNNSKPMGEHMSLGSYLFV
ncbi:unnamed protein product [Calypogeia fissa]